jgi:hypothetical protein
VCSRCFSKKKKHHANRILPNTMLTGVPVRDLRRQRARREQHREHARAHARERVHGGGRVGRKRRAVFARKRRRRRSLRGFCSTTAATRSRASPRWTAARGSWWTTRTTRRTVRRPADLMRKPREKVPRRYARRPLKTGALMSARGATARGAPPGARRTARARRALRGVGLLRTRTTPKGLCPCTAKCEPKCGSGALSSAGAAGTVRAVRSV